MDPDNARLVLRTGHEGIGLKAGHDLIIEVTDWSGQVDVLDGGAAATVSARFELGSMAVREGVGGARPLTELDRGEIEENARRVVGRGRPPTAIFESGQVVAADGGGMIRGTVTLGGVTTPVEVRVQRVAPDRYRGSAVVSQSALGSSHTRPSAAF